MKPKSARSQLEEDICIHIFTVSAAMVGVVFTCVFITLSIAVS